MTTEIVLSENFFFLKEERRGRKDLKNRFSPLSIRNVETNNLFLWGGGIHRGGKNTYALEMTNDTFRFGIK